jgi:membrane protein required for colicin V production
MHWLDFVLLLVLGLGALLGARSGFVWQVARVLVFGVAVYACINYHGVAAERLSGLLTSTTPAIVWLLAYIVTFVAVCLVGFLLTYGIERLVRAAQLKPVDRLLGAVVGVLKAGLLAGAILMGVAVYATPNSDHILAESKVAPVVLEGMRLVIVAVPKDYKDKVSDAVERLKKEGQEAGKRAIPKKPDPLNDPLD